MNYLSWLNLLGILIEMNLIIPVRESAMREESRGEEREGEGRTSNQKI